VGVGASGGYINDKTGDVDDIRGVTYNVNAGGTAVGGTAMFNEDGKLVGFTAGPSADIGLSGTYAKTGALSLREFGSWLGGWLYDRFGKKVCP
jgi:hypothetical protein